MALQRDSLGRIKRKCKKRSNPMKIYRKDEFVARYRLSKKVVKSLVKKFKPHSSTKGTKNGGGLSHSNRFCLALRYLSTGGNFALCGDTQHVSKALVSRAVADLSDYFYTHSKEYIHWPATFDEKLKNATAFFKHKDQGTPNIIGMVDGTHIPILRPKKNESCYVNRKNYHSINATMYADFSKRIMNIDARWPGSVNDSYAFHASPVGDACKSGRLGKFILLGDSGYGLGKNLFTPYKKPRNCKQRAFNTWHRMNRARVEQTIGLLKQRFRCLDSSAGYLYHTPQRAAKIVVACCCLHNIAMDHGIRIHSHPNDPWTPARRPLAQPKQKSKKKMTAEIKKVRDDYVDAHF